MVYKLSSANTTGKGGQPKAYLDDIILSSCYGINELEFLSPGVHAMLQFCCLVVVGFDRRVVGKKEKVLEP